MSRAAMPMPTGSYHQNLHEASTSQQKPQRPISYQPQPQPRPSQSSIPPSSHAHYRPHIPHRPSMPSPMSSTVDLNRVHQPKQSHQYQHPARYSPNSPGQSSSSSRPSPSLSSSSTIESLRDSTRHNVMSSNGRDVRGGIPAARKGSVDLRWDVKSPKEDELTTPPEVHRHQIEVRDEVEIHFDQLLETLQVPSSVRAKFTTVAPSVKSSILSSTASSNPAILAHLGLPSSTASNSTPQRPGLKKKFSTPLLRKAKSSSELSSPGSNPQVGKTYRVDGEAFTIVASPQALTSSIIPSQQLSTLRGSSLDNHGRPALNRPSNGPNGRPLSFGLFSPSKSSTKSSGAAGLGINMSGEQPDALISWLKAFKATDINMDVGRMKKLRMLLRHENTMWVEGFLKLGGYKLVLDKMKELLDVEWREEQHDDLMLYEVLRCVKALGTSDIGKAALRHHYPEPFTGLSKLIFSEKKPGDLASRQVIIELLLFLFDLFPPPRTPRSSTSGPQPPTTSSGPSNVKFDNASIPQQGQYFAGPNRRPINIVEEVRGLLVPDIPEKNAEQHEFITKLHRPRVFRHWMQELSDICRDYFWIMCHANNTLWAVDEVDYNLVEKPVAPGGATGGVEFEAMNYVTMHFKLLNLLCQYTAQQDRAKATELHKDLMMSGMDRILVTFRKASTTFYPTLHLEIARYVSHLQLASPNARLPHLIDKMVGPPPEQYRLKMQTPAMGWLEDARRGGRVHGDGSRREGWDLHV